VSVAASPPTPTTAPSPPVGEACPLCGAPLHPEQEWCLHCGAAARTRLAASPNWKAPIALIAAIIALSLGVLAAALVKLAGGSGDSTATPITHTVTAASTPSVTTTTTTPGALLPNGASTATTTTTPSATAPSLVTPTSKQ
jgi:hypothetical protein